MRRAAAAVGAVLLGALACSTQESSNTPPPAAEAPAQRVVGMYTPTPLAGSEGAPPTLAVRPVADEKAAAAAKRSGKDIGPVVTYAGIARADGRGVEADGKTADGTPIYRHPVGSGFMIVIEGRPGINKVENGRSIYRYSPDDPSQRPDLEIEVTRALGDGSLAVCDARRPNIGGVPGIDPPSFAETPKVSAAINDLSCRFETFIESNASCTVNQYGDFEFLRKDSKVQFCMVVARSWQFPQGDTLVSVRLRDTDGNPGPVSRFVLRYQPLPSPAKKAATPVPTATPARRRP
ncbi:hypothetical protein KF840_03380 [bacterium]|nr:hypothetical protein [bacterium]